jgi:hypothetical protein
VNYATQTLASTIRVVKRAPDCKAVGSRCTDGLCGDSFGRVGSLNDPAAVGRAHLIAGVCNAMGGHAFSTEVPSLAVREPAL